MRSSIVACVLLLCSVCVVSVLAVGSPLQPSLPSPQWTPNTVPVLQWATTINNTLQSARASNLFTHRSSASSDVFSSNTGIDGTGLFLVSGSASSRRRSADGQPAWLSELKDLPEDSTCGSPYLPPDNANHLYTVCAPNIVIKRWYDTGVVQWSVRVLSNTTVPITTSPPEVVPTLTQVVGLTNAFSPPGLLVGSSVEGVLIVIDSRSGEWLGQFSKSDLSKLKPTPTAPFESIKSIKAYLPDWNANRTLALAEVTSQVAGQTVTSLIAFRIALPSLTLTADGWYETLIADTSSSASHSVTLSMSTGRLYVRTSTSLFLLTLDSPALKFDIDSETFPLEGRILEMKDGQYILSNKLTRDSTTASVFLYMIRVGSSSHDDVGVVPIEVLDVTRFLPTSSSSNQWHLLIDDSQNQIIIIGEGGINVIRIDFTQPSSPIVTLLWSFTMFEDYSYLTTDGEQGGEMTIRSFSDLIDLQHIHLVEFLPDMLTHTSFILIRCYDLEDPSSSEVLYTFTTHPSPTCSELAPQNECTTCQTSSGTSTARHCAYCESSKNCVEFIPIDQTTWSQQCPNSTFPSTTIDLNDICPSDPDDSGSSSPWIYRGILIGVGVILIFPVVWLIRKGLAARQRRQEDALRRSYQTLSPDQSFVKSTPMSPRLSPETVPAE